MSIPLLSFFRASPMQGDINQVFLPLVGQRAKTGFGSV